MIDPERFGVSFSIKQCRGFSVDPKQTFDWLLHDAGFRRFRLMSYWNEHEKQPGHYDFSTLDWQIKAAQQAGAVVTLCLGARQPRWPENHWPDWAWQLDKTSRSEALLKYIETVVERYKSYDCVISYQLENEALLKSFGRRPEVDRGRLRAEFTLIKRLDPVRPIITSTSTSWGIPLRAPIPDQVGLSYYHVYYNGKKHRYQKAGGHYVILHKLRALLIKTLLHRPTFIHELQLEPWAPKAIWEVSSEEQDKSMGRPQITQSLQRAKQVGLYPIDLWGGEWWYWRHLRGDDSVWHAVRAAIND